MAYRMKLHEQAIRFMIRLNQSGYNSRLNQICIDKFITRNGQIHGHRNTKDAIEEAKKMLALTSPEPRKRGFNSDFTLWDEISHYPSSLEL